MLPLDLVKLFPLTLIILSVFLVMIFVNGIDSDLYEKNTSSSNAIEMIGAADISDYSTDDESTDEKLDLNLLWKFVNLEHDRYIGYDLNDRQTIHVISDFDDSFHQISDKFVAVFLANIQYLDGSMIVGYCSSCQLSTDFER